MRRRVVTVGDANPDIVFTGLTDIPRAEQDTLATGLEVVLGGQTATISRALARLGLAEPGSELLGAVRRRTEPGRQLVSTVGHLGGAVVELRDSAGQGRHLLVELLSAVSELSCPRSQLLGTRGQL